MADKQPDGFFNPFALWQPVMNFWFGTMMASTEETFKLWRYPFSRPLGDEHEVEGDLDIPGPLERDHEHNLHA